MNAKAKPATNPLQGIRILIGRARHQSGSLSTQLRQLGAQVLEIPFIEIRPPRSFRPLDHALKNLATYDWLILTSVNGVEAMWQRMEKLRLPKSPESWNSGRSAPALSERSAAKVTATPDQPGKNRASALRHEPWKSGPSGPRQAGKMRGALAPVALRIAAIGPATQKAIEQRGLPVDIVPPEYVAESVVRALKSKVKGKRILLVRAKVARDVIPRELRRAGAHVDVVEAYETVVPHSSRTRLQAALANPRRRPHLVTFTSSSTVKNFVDLLGARSTKSRVQLLQLLAGIRMASIGPVTSQTLRDLGLPVDIAAKQFTIPGLIQAILESAGSV